MFSGPGEWFEMPLFWDVCLELGTYISMSFSSCTVSPSPVSWWWLEHYGTKGDLTMLNLWFRERKFSSKLICEGLLDLYWVRSVSKANFSLLELCFPWSNGLTCQGPAALKANGSEIWEVPNNSKTLNSISIGHQGTVLLKTVTPWRCS